MQQIILNIENSVMEHKIIELSKQLNKPVEKLCMDAISYFIGTVEKKNVSELNYKTLKTDDFVTKLNFEIDNTIDFDKIELFQNVTNSAEYIHNARTTNWR